MKHFKYFLPSLGVLMLLLIGCSKITDDVQPSTNTTHSALTAENWYTNSISAIKTNGATSSSMLYVESMLPFIDWSSTIRMKTPKGDAFIVPIKESVVYSSSLKWCRRLLVWRDKAGNNQANFVEFYTVDKSLTDKQVSDISSSVISGMQAGRIESVAAFDVNIIIYSKVYNHPSGQAFQDGRPVGSYKITRKYSKLALSNRIGSSMAQDASCNPSTCQDICAQTCANSGSSICVTNCYTQCVLEGGVTTPSTPTGQGPDDPTPNPPGNPPAGPDNGTQSGIGTEPDQNNYGDHGIVCLHDYRGGKLKAVVSINSANNTVANVDLFCLAPNVSVIVQSITTGYDGYNYTVHMNVTTSAADGSNVKVGTIDIAVSSQQDYYSVSGWRDYYWMTLAGL